MFDGADDDVDIGPITQVSVTLDGIPEVVEVHQIQDSYAESPSTLGLEPPKKKKGKGMSVCSGSHLEVHRLNHVCL